MKDVTGSPHKGNDEDEPIKRVRLETDETMPEVVRAEHLATAVSQVCSIPAPCQPPCYQHRHVAVTARVRRLLK